MPSKDIQKANFQTIGTKEPLYNYKQLIDDARTQVEMSRRYFQRQSLPGQYSALTKHAAQVGIAEILETAGIKAAGTSLSVTITHALGFAPVAIVYIKYGFGAIYTEAAETYFLPFRQEGSALLDGHYGDIHTFYTTKSNLIITFQHIREATVGSDTKYFYRYFILADEFNKGL